MEKEVESQKKEKHIYLKGVVGKVFDKIEYLVSSKRREHDRVNTLLESTKQRKATRENEYDEMIGKLKTDIKDFLKCDLANNVEYLKSDKVKGAVTKLLTGLRGEFVQKLIPEICEEIKLEADEPLEFEGYTSNYSCILKIEIEKDKSEIKMIESDFVVLDHEISKFTNQKNKLSH